MSHYDDDIVTSLGGHHFPNPWVAQTTMAARDGRDATATRSRRSWLLEMNTQLVALNKDLT